MRETPFTTFSKKIQIFFAPENMKKPSSKVAHNWPKLFFSVLPIGPKPAQITFSVPKKCLPAQLLYNDFGDQLSMTNGDNIFLCESEMVSNLRNLPVP